MSTHAQIAYATGWWLIGIYFALFLLLKIVKARALILGIWFIILIYPFICLVVGYQVRSFLVVGLMFFFLPLYFVLMDKL